MTDDQLRVELSILAAIEETQAARTAAAKDNKLFAKLGVCFRKLHDCLNQSRAKHAKDGVKYAP